MDDIGTPVAATGAYAVVRTDSGDALVDATGAEQWQLPPESTSDAGFGRITMDDAAVYMMTGENHSVVALDVANGEELWRYEPADLHECAPAYGFGLETDPRSPDVLVLRFDDRVVNGEHYPDRCFNGMPIVPHLVSLDRATGEELFQPIGDSLRLEGITGRFDITGQYYDRLFDLRRTPVITRTDVHTGETRSVEVELEFPEYTPSWFSDAGDDAFVIETDGGAEFASVDEWGRYEAPDFGEATVESSPIPDAPPCSTGRPVSATGYTYCYPSEDALLGTHSQLLGDPSGESLVSRGSGDTEQPIWEVTGWDYNHVLDLFGTDDTETLWDPVVPESSDGPALLVLPITENSLRAFDIRTGEIVWTTEPDNENPPMGAHYVPGVDEILVGSNGHLHAVDARTGEPTWEAPELNGRTFTAVGPALKADKIDGEGGEFRFVQATGE